MKRTFFLQAVGGIDDDLILEADPTAAPLTTNVKNKRICPLWRTFGGIAAALLVVLGVWAASRLGRVTMHDAAEAESAYDGAVGMLGDYQYSANYNDPLEDAADVIVNKSESVDADDAVNAEQENVPAETEAVADTALGTRLTEVTFTFLTDGGTRTEVRQYPNGVPDAKTVLNDYFAAADSEVRCTGVTVVSTDSKTEVKGGIVSYTPGIRTATVILTDDPGDNLLIGSLRVLNQLWTARYYHFEIEDGTCIRIGGRQPAAGYDPRDYLN